MRFAFIPTSNYKVGQIIQVEGESMCIDHFTSSGRNLVVHSITGTPRFIFCICTDMPSIEEGA